MDSGLGCFITVWGYGRRLNLLPIFHRNSANHARTGFNCIGGVSKVLSFAGLGLLLGQVIDDECGLHWIGVSGNGYYSIPLYPAFNGQ